MSIFTRIVERARGKALYDIHPELTERLPILRPYSVMAESGGVASMIDFYTSNVWVHKAIKVLADNIANLDTNVVRGWGREAEIDEEHDVSKLLDNPNSEIGAAELWREWTINMMLGGEHGLEITPSASGKKLLELWPREGQHFSIKPGAGGRRYRRVDYYRIDDNEGAPYTLTPDQFVHFKFYNPQNPWRGLAPLYAVRTGIIIDQLAQAWSRLFFRNQARPDYVIIAPEGVTATEKNDMYKQVDQQVGGGEGLHRPLILEEGITDIKTLSFAPKDLEWIEQRKLSREEIGAIFGVPDEMMGWGRDTYENFDTADRVLWTMTIIPVVGLRDHILTRFFRKGKAINPDERIETDLSDVSQLQEDKTQKIEQLNILAGRSYPVNVVNDWLGLGLPSIRGGDVGYLPLSMVPVTSVDEEPPAPPSSEEERGLKQKSILTYGSPAHERVWKAKQERITPDVERIQRAVKRLIQDQQNRVTRRLRDNKELGRGKFVKAPESIPDVQRLFDLAEETRLWIEALKEATHNISRRIILAELEELGFEEPDKPRRDSPGWMTKQDDEWAEEVDYILRKMAEKTNNTTWLELNDIFHEAEAEGEGIPAIQERLSAYFGGRKSDWETERIARTFITSISNYSSLIAWKESELVTARVWIAALDDRTRESHADMHGETILLGEQYSNGLDYPGDPGGPPEEVINCRCVEVPVLEGE